MTGKEKCKFLKEIRKTMAKKNGIEYNPLECHHEGDCSGTCRYCENEAMILLAELRKKERDGQPIEIDTDTIKTLELLSGINNVVDPQFFQRVAAEEEERIRREERTYERRI